MTSKTKGVREGHNTVTPYVIIKGASDAIEFYKKAFGATEMLRLTDSNGKVQHAEIKIGDSSIMIVDEYPEHSIMRSPQSLGGTSMHIYLYVEDVDAFMAQAINAGAEELMKIEDHSDGDRRGGLTDPFGHIWWVATHINAELLEES
ncbi:VOC family protein [Bacillus sp. IITD106]|nr:VOC family protein [Bacillus sp. IITD106]